MNNVLSSDSKGKSNIVIISYYIILLLIAMSWTNRNLVTPHIVLRITFTLCFILPLFKYSYLAPALITIFATVRWFSIAPFGYLPSQPKLYLYMVLGLYLLSLYNGLTSPKTNRLLIALFVVALFSNLINRTTESPDLPSYNFLRLLLFAIFLGKLVRTSKDLKLMEWGFIIISFCLSIYGIIFYRDFRVAVVVSAIDESMFLQDPNYLSCVLSIGIILSFYYFMYQTKQKRITRIFFLTTFIIGMITILFLASRGAFIAIILPLLYILFMKGRSFKNLIYGVVFICIIVFVFSKLNLFVPLMERFTDTSLYTGSDRTIIWSKTLRNFVNLDLPTIIFGGGSSFSYTFCGEAIGEFISSPHNNFLEILFNYGIIGLIIFLFMIFSWIKNNLHNILAISMILVLVLSSITLVPLMYLPFWSVIVLIEKQKLYSFEES